MKRTVTALIRDEAGKLKITHDRAEIDCDDSHSGIDKLHRQNIAKGAVMSMILLDDDSVSRHWTAPPQNDPKTKH